MDLCESALELDAEGLRKVGAVDGIMYREMTRMIFLRLKCYLSGQICDTLFMYWIVQQFYYHSRSQLCDRDALCYINNEICLD